MRARNNILCLFFTLAGGISGAQPYLDNLGEGVAACRGVLGAGEITGHLRDYVGRQVRFTQAHVAEGQTIALGYELNVISVSQLVEPLRQTVADLVRWTHAPEAGAHERAAVVTWGITETFQRLIYSSADPDFVRSDDNLLALQMLRNFFLIRKTVKQRVDGDGEGVVIHRLHTHPEGGAVAHSARDILTDLSTYEELKRTFGSKVRFISHVIPLGYGGDVILTFDPDRHRVY